MAITQKPFGKPALVIKSTTTQSYLLFTARGTDKFDAGSYSADPWDPATGTHFPATATPSRDQLSLLISFALPVLSPAMGRGSVLGVVPPPTGLLSIILTNNDDGSNINVQNDIEVDYVDDPNP